jgi:hypothetical protein
LWTQLQDTRKVLSLSLSLSLSSLSMLVCLCVLYIRSKICCKILVFNSVTSTPQWTCQPRRIIRPGEHTPTCTHPRTHAPTQPRTHAPTRTHAHTHTRTHTHAHTHAHTHTHTRTHTHTHTHTQYEWDTLAFEDEEQLRQEFQQCEATLKV